MKKQATVVNIEFVGSGKVIEKVRLVPYPSAGNKLYFFLEEARQSKLLHTDSALTDALIKGEDVVVTIVRDGDNITFNSDGQSIAIIMHTGIHAKGRSFLEIREVATGGFALTYSNEFLKQFSDVTEIKFTKV